MLHVPYHEEGRGSQAAVLGGMGQQVRGSSCSGTGEAFLKTMAKAEISWTCNGKPVKREQIPRPRKHNEKARK